MLLQLSSLWSLVLPTFATLFFVAAALRVFSAGLLHRTTEDPDFPAELERSPSESEGEFQVYPQAGGLQTHRTSTVNPRYVYDTRTETNTDEDPEAIQTDAEPSEETDSSETILPALIPNVAAMVPRGFKLFLFYLIVMQLFVQVCGPYFAPYMLKHLEMGYGTYVGLISLAFVAKIASTMVWGRLAERFGSSWVLFVGGLGLIPLASLWSVSSAIWWLAVRRNRQRRRMGCLRTGVVADDVRNRSGGQASASVDVL